MVFAVIGIVAVGVILIIQDKSAYHVKNEFTASSETTPTVQALPVFPHLIVKGERFNIDIAKTAAEREQGLSGRAGLGKREAMLFIFDTDDRHGFWMKDMLFSIDIVWLDADYKIVHIQNNASPASYPKAFLPDTNSRFVLEFTAGTVAEFGLQKGDLVSIFQ